MLLFTLRRILMVIPTLFFIAVVSFALIQLPPGDFLTSYMARLMESGDMKSEEGLAASGCSTAWTSLSIPSFSRGSGICTRGDMGYSFSWNRPVNELVGERLVLTFILAIVTLIFTYLLALPIGIYSATHQYSPSDYLVTFVGFVGLATPGFLLALIFMFFSTRYLGISAGGLFSQEFIEARWNLAKALDLFKHVWIPVVIIGAAGTAGAVRVMRANLLDELKKQYVVTARAKGVSELRLLLKYPIRIAINPMISTVGWLLPTYISEATIASVVLNLPTTGPLLLGALLNQDMYLAGSIIMIFAFLTVIGTLVSDILLALADPRIRFGAKET